MNFLKRGNILIRAFVLFFVVITLILPLSVSAKEGRNIGNALEFLGKTNKTTGLSEENLTSASGSLIKKALSATGIIFLVLSLYAGFLWMTAQGNDDKVEQAKNILIGSVIGLIVIVSAYSITSIIIDRLQSAATGSGPSGGAGDNTPQGCCMDKISDGLGLIGDGVWACRITTQADCQTVGTSCSGGDNFCTSSDVKFFDGETNLQFCSARCQ